MIESFREFHPEIHPEAWVHPSAVIVGEVRLGRGASVWPGAVLRGDEGAVVIGEDTNIQDGVIAHATGGLSRTTIGARVTVGHRAILHGCTVADEVLVGMGAILLDNCVVERHCVIGAGALVPVGRRIPERSLVMGTPARVVRTLSDEEIERIVLHGAREYLSLVAGYRGEGGRSG